MRCIWPSKFAGRRLFAACFSLLFSALMASAAAPARAEMIVLSSTAPALIVGSVVEDGDLIELPPGTDARLIFEGGRIVQVSGPFKGRARDLAPASAQGNRAQGAATSNAAKSNKAMWDRLKRAIKKRQSSANTAAASRSLASGQSAEPDSAFSWRVVPAHSDGTICVDTADELMLSRPPLGSVSDMTIIDQASETRAVVRWRDGSNVSPWPRLVPPVSDKGYLLLVSKLPVREIRLQILPAPLPVGDAALEVLFDHGCRFQMEAWIEQELG